MLFKLLRWVVDITAQQIVGGLLGSAVVTSIVNFIVRQYTTMSWEAAWVLWTSTALIAFVAMVKVIDLYNRRTAHPQTGRGIVPAPDALLLLERYYMLLAELQEHTWRVGRLHDMGDGKPGDLYPLEFTLER